MACTAMKVVVNFNVGALTLPKTLISKSSDIPETLAELVGR